MIPKKAIPKLGCLPLWGFQILFSEEREQPWLFVVFKIIISYIFIEKCIEIHQLSFSFKYFHQVLDFLTFPCNQKTHDSSIKQFVTIV